MKLYLPALRVRLEDWCSWTGNSYGKVRAVVGSSFRMRGRQESIYTMAANAALRLLIDYDVDPARIGFLGLGTESSSDNSAGAVIVKGMLDRALRQLGRPSLARSCEVPEFKHACLGGVYALKSALRYLAHDGRGRQAIVVCGDIAEYERGSSGEQTQGAGTVAMLLEQDPALLRVELHRSGSASDYRGPDFRKPFQRHVMGGEAPRTTKKIHDFPVFSGKYSTVCYIDETLRAVEDMFDKIRVTPRTFYHEVAGLFLHRPYHQMPVNGMAALYTWGLSRSEAHLPELRALCAEAGADFDRVLEEMRSRPNLFENVLAGKSGEEVYPESMKAVKRFRATPKFQEAISSKMALGSERMMELGNLYTASLPAWVAAGIDEAAERKLDITGKEFVMIGYGSGDAAEAIPIRAAEGWQGAAARIGFQRSLDRAIDLTREQYEALHDGHEVPGLDHPPSGEFVIDRLGDTKEADFQDVGVEYYRYVP
jgi:hydroxymethylglutaryl-CoA synthase